MEVKGVKPWERTGQWVQCGITGMGFPAEPMAVTFQGHTLYLLPGKTREEGDKFGDLYPVVAFEHSGMSFEAGQMLISSFINSVAWVRGAGINTAMFGGGSRVHGLGGRDAKALVDKHFELDYLPEPTDEKARLALAFYREGLTLNSPAYQCLSFFKILNIRYSKGKEQSAWIDSNIEMAKQRDVHGTKDWEEKAGFDPATHSVGEYLFKSNRCAIAHAFNEPLIHPDDPTDRARLYNDLPMIKALAEHFIEQEFGIKSAATIWREHLYELQGFTYLFGAELVARIKSGEEIPLEAFPPIPNLSLRLALTPAFPSFENLRAEVVDCHDGTVNLLLTEDTDCVAVGIALNFQEERLNFELFQHLAVSDDGRVSGAQATLDQLRFTSRYLCNGKLELWTGGKRMSQCDPFIPQNIDLGATIRAYSAQIEEAETEVQRRISPA